MQPHPAPGATAPLGRQALCTEPLTVRVDPGHAALSAPGALSRLVHDLPLGVVHLSPDGAVLAANSAARALLEGSSGAALAAALQPLAARAAEAASPVTEAVVPGSMGEVRVLLTAADGGGLLAVLDRDHSRRLRDQAIALRGMLAAAVECEQPEAALQRALEALARACRDSELALWIVSATGELEPIARARGCGAPLARPAPEDEGAELVRRAVETGLPVHAPRPGRGAALADLGLQPQGEMGAALALPVRDGGAAVGALLAVGPRLGEGELRLLAGLADAAGSLLGRARARAALQEAEAKAERARAVAVEREGLATLGHLAACVTHEIAGPLGCLGSNLRAALENAEALAQEGEARPPGEQGRAAAAELTQILREAVADISRVMELTRSLRSLSRRTADEGLRFDPVGAVQDAVRIFRGAHRAAGGVLLSSPPTFAEVEGNPGLLCQVVLNLLDNALDAAEGRGPIEVRLCETSGRWIALEVADRGTGIPPEIRERVFDAYFTTKAPGRGTGLGLYICKDVVERMGGRISFECGPDGTTFRVELPPAALTPFPPVG